MHFYISLRRYVKLNVIEQYSLVLDGDGTIILIFSTLLAYSDFCLYIYLFYCVVVKKGVDREADNRRLLQLEENGVISSVATVLSDLCEPSEWMPMLQLHEEVSFPPLRTIR
jgi:hypothetical protein